MTADRPDDQPWRIGASWGIHVYQGEKGSPGERYVGTFPNPADAQRAVDAVNGAERLARERVVEALRGFYVDAADRAATLGRRGPHAVAEWLLDIGQDRLAALTADDRPGT